MSLSKRSRIFLMPLLGITIALGVSALRVSHGGGPASGQPKMNVYSTSPPGETKRLDRPYNGAPPLVPHDVLEFNMSRSANDCLDCHLEGVEIEEGHIATKVPPSHYLNEYRGEGRKDQVTGIRYNCLQCHLPQASGEPPVSQRKPE
jgi:cytochrome c-type protein NapB